MKINRLPKEIQSTFERIYNSPPSDAKDVLKPNGIYRGDARKLIPRIQTNSIAVSVWSPPYFVGKEYEQQLTFDDWQNLLKDVIREHFRITKPGGFLAVNIADILCFKDRDMPRIQAEAVNRKKVDLSREDILEALTKHPNMSRYDLAKHFNCSEQTIDRRLNGNNVRGGKHQTQTRVKIVGGLVEDWALNAGFYPYDRRIWHKDAAWENSRWASLSYRAVDEFEYIYFFWKPGVTKFDRQRLSRDEWKNWGSRGVWQFPSVRTNDDHEAKFPIELPTRVIRLLSDPGDTILDCFVGSGTSAVAAVREGRKFIGIDIEAKYVALAKRRLNKELGLVIAAENNVN